MSFLFRHLPTAGAALNTACRAVRLYVSDGSWRGWAPPGSHYLKKIRGIPTPTFVTVGVTYRCQCRCTHCYSDSPSRPTDEETTTDEIKSGLSELFVGLAFPAG